jgi:hypothetical protein
MLSLFYQKWLAHFFFLGGNLELFVFQKGVRRFYRAFG